jgi:hypothetical protein
MASITGAGAGSRFLYIAGAATTQVVTGKGVLRAIIFNKPVASSTVKLIDGTSGTTANMGIITNTSAVEPYQICYDVKFRDGLRIVTSGADDITVVYD